MNEVLTLLSERGKRDVFAGVRSIGQSEFYEASARDFAPEMKFVLRDYLDYDGEQYARYSGRVYKVIRTYLAGQEMELTVQRASVEEAGLYE